MTNTANRGEDPQDLDYEVGRNPRVRHAMAQAVILDAQRHEALEWLEKRKNASLDNGSSKPDTSLPPSRPAMR